MHLGRIDLLHRIATQHTAHPHIGRFLAGRHVNKHRNQNQEDAPSEKGINPQGHRKRPAHRRSDVRGRHVVQAHRQQRAEHAPAIQRESRDQVERRQENVVDKHIGKQRQQSEAAYAQTGQDSHGVGHRQAKQHHHRAHQHGNNHIHQRSGNGNHKLLQRFVGDTRQLSHPTNRRQHNLLHRHAVAQRRIAVSQLMQGHQHKEQGDGHHPKQGPAQITSEGAKLKRRPQQNEGKGDVDPDVDVPDGE